MWWAQPFGPHMRRAINSNSKLDLMFSHSPPIHRPPGIPGEEKKSKTAQFNHRYSSELFRFRRRANMRMKANGKIDEKKCYNVTKKMKIDNRKSKSLICVYVFVHWIKINSKYPTSISMLVMFTYWFVPPPPSFLLRSGMRATFCSGCISIIPFRLCHVLRFLFQSISSMDSSFSFHLWYEPWPN